MVISQMFERATLGSLDLASDASLFPGPPGIPYPLFVHTCVTRAHVARSGLSTAIKFFSAYLYYTRLSLAPVFTRFASPGPCLVSVGSCCCSVGRSVVLRVVSVVLRFVVGLSVLSLGRVGRPCCRSVVIQEASLLHLYTTTSPPTL